MVAEVQQECPGCARPVAVPAADCCCGWHHDGGIPPVAELAEAAPL